MFTHARTSEFMLHIWAAKTLIQLTGLGALVLGMGITAGGFDITPGLICGILAFIFHLGMSWQTFMDHKRRLLALETAHARLSDIFAMRDGLRAVTERMDKLEDRVDILHDGAGR